MIAPPITTDIIKHSLQRMTKFFFYTFLVLDPELIKMINSGDDLPDDVIDAAVRLMKESDTEDEYNIQPIKPSEMKNILSNPPDKSLQHIKPSLDRNVISIHHVSSPEHWVTTYFDVSKQNIYIYDSLTDVYREDKIAPQLDVLYNNSVNKFKVIYQPVTQQKMNMCGFYAIACAFCRLQGKNPEAQLFDEDRMRVHLIDCLRKRNIACFPDEEEAYRSISKLNYASPDSVKTSAEMKQDAELKPSVFTDGKSTGGMDIRPSKPEKMFPSDSRIVRVDVDKLMNYCSDIPKSTEDVEKAVDAFVAAIKMEKQNMADVILESLILKDETQTEMRKRGFIGKIYHTRHISSCAIQNFVKELVSEKNGERIVTESASSSFIIVFYRIVKDKPEIFLMTTGQNWHYADRIACDSFPNQIASKMMKDEFTYRELIDISGGPLKAIEKHAKTGKVLPKEDIKYNETEGKIESPVTEKFKAELNKLNLCFKKSKKAINMKGNLSFSDILYILVMFSQNSTEDEPKSERLRKVVDDTLRQRLDAVLVDKFRETVNKKHITGVFLELPEAARRVYVVLPNSEKKVLLRRPIPCLDEILNILTKYQIDIANWLDIKLEIGRVWYELKRVIEYQVTMGEERYIYQDGYWHSFVYQYWYDFEKQFLDVLKSHFLKPPYDIPLLKWRRYSSKQGEFTPESYRVQTCMMINENTSLHGINPNNFSLLYQTKIQLHEGSYNDCYTLLQEALTFHDYHRFTFILGDNKLIKNIELYDVLIVDQEMRKTYIVHVKDGFGQSIRDACNQLRNSAEIIHQDLSPGKVGTTLSQYHRRNKLRQYGIEEETFLSFFTDEGMELIFLLAVRDLRQPNISLDAEKDGTQRTIHEELLKDKDLQKSKVDIEGLYTNLQTNGAIDSNGCLTDELLILTKQDEIIAKFLHSLKPPDVQKPVLATLLRFKSSSDSSIAKRCVISLKNKIEKYWLGHRNFKLGIVNLADNWLEFKS